MKVKVCGITRLEDARLAHELGAWAVGFVFARESARFIAPERAGEISRALPPELLKVAVVVNPSQAELEEIVSKSGVDRVQFHGEESAEECARSPRPYFKALRPSRAGDLEALRDFAAAELILIDAAGAERGGTGKRADWTLAAEAVSRAPGRVLLAGGLDAASVTDAIHQVNPVGLDVSSRLESSPGVKDPAKVRDFFAAVRKVQP